GVIILIIILLLIFSLLGILYYLRKKARSYSFDLTHVDVAANDYTDTPLRSDQQGISYEQTNKGKCECKINLPVCSDYVQEDKTTEEKTNPIANGSCGEKTEQAPTNDNDYQNVPEENSFSSNSSLSTPMKNEDFNLYLNLLGGDLNDLTEAEATDTTQNENNNNVSNAGQYNQKKRRLGDAAKKAISQLQVCTIRKGDQETESDFDNCAVCIEGYKPNDVVRILPCRHLFHKGCVDPWLVDHRTCPMCKMNILKALGLTSSAECLNELPLDYELAVGGVAFNAMVMSDDVMASDVVQGA
ncbi:hypothetical protein cypCar_00031326, partial [Cyprinus carpio]